MSEKILKICLARMYERTEGHRMMAMHVLALCGKHDPIVKSVVCIESVVKPWLLTMSLELFQLQDLFVKVVDDIRLESEETERRRPRIRK